MIYYKSLVREEASASDALKKIKKVFEKVLTNANLCSIILKVAQKRGTIDL